MRESSGKPCRSTMAGSAPGWSITCKPPPGACTRWVVMWLAWPGTGIVPHFSVASPARPVASALWCCGSAIAGAHDLRVALHLAHRRSALQLRVSHDAALIVQHEHLEPGACHLARAGMNVTSHAGHPWVLPRSGQYRGRNWRWLRCWPSQLNSSSWYLREVGVGAVWLWSLGSKPGVRWTAP